MREANAVYPFRIEARAPIQIQDARVAAPTEQALSDYMDRLIKLIPAEILGLYLTVRGFWVPNTVNNSLLTSSSFLKWWPLICVVLLWISRAWGTRAAASWRTVQIAPIAIATVSLVIWIFAMGHAILDWTPDPKAASTAVVIWVFLVPLFYKGSEPIA
jgi:hypothetical protein